MTIRCPDLCTIRLCKYRYLIIGLIILVLIGCASQPRFRSEPAENKRSKALLEEETQNTEGIQSTNEEEKAASIRTRWER